MFLIVLLVKIYYHFMRMHLQFYTLRRLLCCT